MRKLKKQRGAAMVEMALSMIVLIPVFLYTLFLNDLLKFRLDQQEATVSTLWDYTIQNYDQALPTETTDADNPGNRTAVQKYSRSTYCDHEGALDSDGSQQVTVQKGSSSYQSYVDCNHNGGTSKDHHMGELAAHACWLGQGKEVTCTSPDKNVGVVSAANGYAQKFQQGGMFTCSARLEVQNHLLPQKFFNDSFSKVDLTKHKYDVNSGEDVHKYGSQGDSSNSYVFQEDTFSLLTDTWALTEVQNIDPGGKGKLQERAAYVYENVPALSFAWKGMAYIFTAAALQSQAVIVNPNHLLDVNVSIHARNGAPTKSVKQEGSNRSYFDSAWMDWAKNNTQQTYNRRGDYYMGCRQAGKSC
ncbi:MAG: hypothetical protein IRZ16_13940 [Myxococcaceae bacterium]|nr:hypothetical protein [Myxococcaceae bacterium]